MKTSFQPVTYLIGGRDVQGQLVFLDGRLAAALAFLDGDAYLPQHQGLWNLEAGFGCCDPMLRSEPFESLDDAAAWVMAQSQPKASWTMRHQESAAPQPGKHAVHAPSPSPDTTTDEADSFS